MIILRFSRGDGIAGAAVRWKIWSWCAHVGFLVSPNQVLDAAPGTGVSIRMPQWEPSDRYFAADVPAAAIAWGKTQLGLPYDYLGVFGNAIHRDLSRRGAWFCDAFVEWCCWKAGCPLVRVDRLDRVTPRDLLLSPLLRELSRKKAIAAVPVQ